MGYAAKAACAASQTQFARTVRHRQRYRPTGISRRSL